jgi:tetratricopeptide (TPR) repeat protein
MPGRTIYLSDNPNDFHWAIPEDRARAFEDLVLEYLNKYVATQDGRVRKVRTPVVGDAGRDFEVYFEDEVELFGLKIQRPTGRAGVVFVECKATGHPRLDDGFIADASQHHKYESCAYVLVTNAVVTPYNQRRAQQEWKLRKSTFHLVDRRRLADEIYLRRMDGEANRRGLRLPPPSSLPEFDRSRLVVSCQTESDQSVGSQAVNVYMAMRNYGPETVLAAIDIATDMRWLASDSHYECMIPPGFVETIELAAERQEFSGPDELDLTLRVNHRSQRLTVASPPYKLSLEPLFTGTNHRRIMQEISADAETADSFKLISVQGEAGAGKTRTVKEALRPLRGGRLNFFSYIFSRQQGAPSFEDFYETFGLTSESAAGADAAARVSELIGLAAKTDAPMLIHLEDLHHADEGVIKVFKQAAVRPHSCTAPLILIVTGRDDHTFPNEEYYSFLQLVTDQTLGHVHSYTIPPLTDKDAETLIRGVVENMPEPGVERVLALGQNNPFVILEVLQYLLDVRLVKLLSRRTMGVLNPEVFAGRDGLPKTVEELYNRRLNSLKTAPAGELAYAFLIAASFFGFLVEPDVRRTFFDGEEEGEESWALLRERRFVKEADGRGATFAHENLLHHARSVARRPENSESAASLILERPGLARRLGALDLGEVYYLHKDYAEAFKSFAEVWERIRRVTNFSSEEIDKNYFKYLPPLFHAAKAVGESKEDLSKVALAHGYMGVHNFPLVVAENACALSNDLLGEIYHRRDEGLKEKLAVRQLRAHALQNMGRASQAIKEMLEIEASLTEANQHWPEVEFDLYDRMQTYYQKINHEEMVRFYSRQASNSVKQSDDAKLRAAHLITQSIISMFSGEQNARERAADAHEASVSVKVQRFIIYTRLTELVVAALYSRQDTAVLKLIYEEARGMLRDAAWNNFSDSIMRIELLLGTLALNCYDDAKQRHEVARFYINSGQANSLRFGNGLFDWAFDNLAAVIDLREGKDEDVRRRFRSCLERLNKRGLTFLGAQSGIYPNTFAISNIVRFFGQFKDSECIELVRSAFSTYDNRFLEDEDEGIALVARAVKGRPIFCPERLKFQMPRYPASDGYFTPVF